MMGHHLHTRGDEEPLAVFVDLLRPSGEHGHGLLCESGGPAVQVQVSYAAL